MKDLKFMSNDDLYGDIYLTYGASTVCPCGKTVYVNTCHLKNQKTIRRGICECGNLFLREV